MHRLGDVAAHRDPLVQLETWLDEARTGGDRWADVMCLATCGPDGRPSARAVVMRSLDQSGLVFESDYQSRKAVELAANPRAAAVFVWPRLQRQVRCEGRAVPVTAEESDRRFDAAPREQRLAVHASFQSRPIGARQQLEHRLKELEEQFSGAHVPRPPHWGGYRLEPSAMEFWQGRSDRLHDRLLYRRSDGEAWAVERLSP